MQGARPRRAEAYLISTSSTPTERNVVDMGLSRAAAVGWLEMRASAGYSGLTAPQGLFAFFEKLAGFVGVTSGSTYSIAAVAGYPSITVPVGLRHVPGAPAQDKLPELKPSIVNAGIIFFGGAWSEPKLIKYAYAFEQMTKGRVTPQFLPTFPKS